jgi:hypothetical protein
MLSHANGRLCEAERRCVFGVAMINTTSHTKVERGRSPRVDDRCEKHANHTVGLRERLRLANKNGELLSTAQLQQEGVFGLRPVNRIGDLRKGQNLPTYYDIQRIKCSHGVYRWKLHEPPRAIEKQEWRSGGRGEQLFLPEQPSRDRYEREHRPRPSGETAELPLFSGVRY